MINGRGETYIQLLPTHLTQEVNSENSFILSSGEVDKIKQRFDNELAKKVIKSFKALQAGQDKYKHNYQIVTLNDGVYFNPYHS